MRRPPAIGGQGEADEQDGSIFLHADSSAGSSDAGVRILIITWTRTLPASPACLGVKSAWTASGPGGTLRSEDLDRFTVSSVKLGVSPGLTLFRL